jgi:transposase InsO family protein
MRFLKSAKIQPTWRSAGRRVALSRGAPRMIRVDNGPELISKALDRRAYESGVTLDFSRPGTPTDNAFVESYTAGDLDVTFGK